MPTLTPPVVGQRVSDFVLPDATGTPRRLSEFLTRGPLVLLFYRGHWCPFCLRQLGNYRESYAELRATGADLAALAVDDPGRSGPMSHQLAVPFAVLCDPERTVVGSWGLIDEHEKGSISAPATVVIGQDWTIKFCSVDVVNKRVSVEEVLAFLRSGTATAPADPQRAAVVPGPREWLRGIANALRRGTRVPRQQANQ